MLEHFISIGLALVVSVTSFFSGSYTVHKATTTPYTAPSVKIAAPKPAEFEKLFHDITKAAPSTTPKVIPPSAIEIPKSPVLTPPSVFTPVPLPTPPAITKPTVPSPTPVTSPSVATKKSSEELLKGAIVNIVCTQGGGLQGESGSGVIIDPRGIVMTVAHVGQGFLLNDYPTQGTGKCFIRTGSPAKTAYTAKLIYISREWVKNNPDTFLENRPTGTGENDYALLAITGSASASPLPRTFNYIPLVSSGFSISEGDTVGTGSYGAEFLTNAEIHSSLYPTISFAPVNNIYSFDGHTEDLFSVQAGSAAQAGSSGGAIIDSSNHLIGIITTRTVKTKLSLRNLQAISIDHARRSFNEDMGENFDTYLQSASPSTLSSKFSEKSPALLTILRNAIEE